MELGQVQNGVRVISIVDLLENLFGKEVFQWNGPSYKEQSEGVKKWVAENNAHYYADVRENFSIFTGIHQAKKESKQIVVVEDLS